MKTDSLDKIFSQYIRLRDRITGTQYVKCISCGKVVDWKESDCGHYVNRKHKSTRWDEKNCNAQCQSCNRFDEGCMSGYTLGLIKKYGSDTIEMLHYKKHQVSKLSQFEVDQLLKYYKEKVKEML
jgi:hypothetical protein